MERVAALGRRVLPRGWGHFWTQVALWLGFYVTYLAVRAVADRNTAEAVSNGQRVISFEYHLTHHLYELTAQRIVDSSRFLLMAAAWTYWNSEFTVISLALLWVYLRRHERFGRFRNAILLANLIGLICFALMPTAPPWMFPADGFIGGVNHSSALLHTLGNQYAAMPSLHAADALIVGCFLALSCRRVWARALWLLWPLWVWFCVIATANHYVLDVLAGIGVAIFSLIVTAWAPRVVGRARALGPVIANLL
ncbi:MAG TPA: phosphatase PAP2 family protein [Gaiellaceae bacterium]|nr:phosphatase PAP2 family protein [Gaiellaceae bacterium]